MSKTMFVTHGYLVLLRKALNCKSLKLREKTMKRLSRFFEYRSIEQIRLESERDINTMLNPNDMFRIKLRLSILKDEREAKRLERAGVRLHECSFAPVR